MGRMTSAESVCTPAREAVILGGRSRYTPARAGARAGARADHPPYVMPDNAAPCLAARLPPARLDSKKVKVKVKDNGPWHDIHQNARNALQQINNMYLLNEVQNQRQRSY